MKKTIIEYFLNIFRIYISKARKSIRTKTIFIIVIILTISIGLSMVVSTFIIKSIVKDALENETYATGLLIRNSINNNLKYFSLDSFSGMVKFLNGILITNKNIAYCFISEYSTKKVLYHNESDKIGYFLDTNLYKEAILKQQSITIDNGSYYETILPIYYFDKIIGNIHIGVNKSVIDDKILMLIVTMIIIFILSLFVSISLLLIFITRNVITPISRLSLEMKGITGSLSFNRQIDIKGEDEISELAANFNVMLNSVKNAEQRLLQNMDILKKSENKFRAIFEQTFQFIGLMTIDGTLIEVNKTALNFAGVDESSIIGKPFWETPFWTHSTELQEKLRESIQRAARGELVRFEATHKSLDGSLHYVDFSIKPALDEAGNIILLIPEGRDITERKKAEAALSASEEKFSKAFQHAADIVGIVRLIDQCYIEANDAFYNILGYRQDEVIGHSSSEFGLWGGDTESRMQLFTAFENKGAVRDLEMSWLTKSGEMRVGLLSAEVMGIGGERCIVYVWHDVTDRKRLEDQLIQLQKMEAVGRLAGGIAHDFNNFLTAIIGYCGLIMKDMDPRDKSCSDIKEILKAAERSASLTQQLLAFSRKQILTPKNVDINQIVSNMEKMLKRLIGENVKFTTVLMDKLDTVHVDQGQIEQVIMNLVVNSRDAMPEGGAITIRTGNKIIDNDDAGLIPNAKSGNYVFLSIEDSGVGIEENELGKIFEPFYSTKGLGKGTGLGLSVVDGIIAQHGGWINVSSKIGVGTTINIYLPSFPSKMVTMNNDQLHTELSSGNCERILVIEDQPEVLKFISKALKNNGYKVFEANCGREATNLFERENGQFDLIFSDVVLPDIRGTQLIEQFLKLKPDVPVLLSSGYTDQKSQWEFIQERGFRFLEKPYSLSELLKTINEVIKGKIYSK